MCGQALRPGARCPNYWCQRRDRGFSVAFSIGAYDGALRHALTRYKYQEERWLGPTFARMLASYMTSNLRWFEEFDLIAPVPAFAGRGARRDWDPVGAVAEQMAVLLGPAWDVAPGLLAKARETPALTGLPWARRQAVAVGPLRHALRVVDRRRVVGARVLVVDDVFTEGATLREVARVLCAAGATDVAGLAIARRNWSEGPPASGERGQIVDR